MNKRHTNKLFKEFPTFYRIKKPITASLMRFGFMCDDGWFNLIYQLSKDIQAILNNYPEASWVKDFEVLEVKEKFGELRFYVIGASNEVHILIEKAEVDSKNICEICGKPGQLCMREGWWRTVCKECGEKEGYEAVRKTES